MNRRPLNFQYFLCPLPTQAKAEATSALVNLLYVTLIVNSHEYKIVIPVVQRIELQVRQQHMLHCVLGKSRTTRDSEKLTKSKICNDVLTRPVGNGGPRGILQS